MKKELVVVDPMNNLRGIISYGNIKPFDKVEGVVTNLPLDLDVFQLIKINYKLKIKKQKSLFDITCKDLIKRCNPFTLKNFKKAMSKRKAPPLELISEVTGSWVKKIFIDGEEYWDSKRKTFLTHMVKDPLPSDTRFREDILWILYNDISNAQKWKLELEGQIRFERKKRQKLNLKRIKQNKKK